ncbi:MAG: hypothetical protein JXA25_15685 [Anaerolineales bacterium]|nr:hypothetical protein [Anaerolineales bacterium]
MTPFHQDIGAVSLITLIVIGTSFYYWKDYLFAEYQSAFMVLNEKILYAIWGGITVMEYFIMLYFGTIGNKANFVEEDYFVWVNTLLVIGIHAFFTFIPALINGVFKKRKSRFPYWILIPLSLFVCSGSFFLILSALAEYQA